LIRGPGRTYTRAGWRVPPGGVRLRAGFAPRAKHCPPWQRSGGPEHGRRPRPTPAV